MIGSPMDNSITYQFFAKSDVGRKRDHNEDSCLINRSLSLVIVADGMGGHAAGEVASAIAVRTINDEILKEKTLLQDFCSGASGASKVTVREVLNLIEYAMQRACSRIYDEARSDSSKRGMGTTASLLLIAGAKGFIGHVGDSRIYLVRGGQGRQITEDHTVYNELIKRGKLTREQIEQVAQKHAITRALGVYEQVDVDTLSLDLLPDDQILLCSDGLHGYVQSMEDIEQRVEMSDGDEAASCLVDMANERGGKDNITVALVRVLGDGTESVRQRVRRLSLKREVLMGVPLFARLTERELLRVMQVADVRSYEAGQCVIRDGDTGDELFVMLSGSATVRKGEAVLSTLGRGEHFGEMALIRNQPRSADVVAQQPSDIAVIRRADFYEILRTEHGMAVKMLWQFLGVLAERLDQTSKDLRSAREEIEAEDITADVFLQHEPSNPSYLEQSPHTSWTDMDPPMLPRDTQTEGLGELARGIDSCPASSRRFVRGAVMSDELLPEQASGGTQVFELASPDHAVPKDEQHGRGNVEQPSRQVGRAAKSPVSMGADEAIVAVPIMVIGDSTSQRPPRVRSCAAANDARPVEANNGQEVSVDSDPDERPTTPLICVGPGEEQN